MYGFTDGWSIKSNKTNKRKYNIEDYQLNEKLKHKADIKGFAVEIRNKKEKTKDKEQN